MILFGGAPGEFFCPEFIAGGICLNKITPDTPFSGGNLTGDKIFLNYVFRIEKALEIEDIRNRGSGFFE